MTADQPAFTVTLTDGTVYTAHTGAVSYADSAPPNPMSLKAEPYGLALSWYIPGRYNGTTHLPPRWRTKVIPWAEVDTYEQSDE